jgi:hypothetical protein
VKRLLKYWAASQPLTGRLPLQWSRARAGAEIHRVRFCRHFAPQNLKRLLENRVRMRRPAVVVLRHEVWKEVFERRLGALRRLNPPGATQSIRAAPALSGSGVRFGVFVLWLLVFCGLGVSVFVRGRLMNLAGILSLSRFSRTVLWLRPSHFARQASLSVPNNCTSQFFHGRMGENGGIPSLFRFLAITGRSRSKRLANSMSGIVPSSLISSGVHLRPGCR